MSYKVKILCSLVSMSLITLNISEPKKDNEPLSLKEICTVEPENNEKEEYSQDQIKSIAEKITVKISGNNSRGSGVIIGQSKNSYLVATNTHAVTDDSKDKIEVKTYDKDTHSAQILPNSRFENVDLTILMFTSKNTYCPVKGILDGPLSINTEVLASGYPSDSPGIKLSAGTVKFISKPSLRNGYEIGYTSDIRPGMSGGPIINKQGYLIGLNGRISYPLLNHLYVYMDGRKLTESEIQKYRELSWGIPGITILGHIKQEIIKSYSLPIKSTFLTMTEELLKKWKEEIENEAKQFIVKINDDGNNSKLGVIVKRENNVYTVLTTYNNVEKKENHPISNINFTLTTFDNKTHLVNLINSNLKKDSNVALIKFISQENYQVAKLRNSYPENKEYIFTINYKDKKLDSPWNISWGLTGNKANEKRILTSKELSFQNPNFSLGGYDLTYGAINKFGTSGSPLVDIQGQVIGIHLFSEEEIINNKQEKNSDNEKGITQLGDSVGISINKISSLYPEFKYQKQKTQFFYPELTKILNSIKNLILSTDINQENNDSLRTLEIGNRLSILGEYEEALKYFNSIIDTKTDSKEPELLHLAHYGKGLVLYKNKKYEEASVVFEEALKLNPDFTPLLQKISRVYEKLGMIEKSINAIDKAIATQSQNPNLHNEKFLILNNLNKHEEAEKSINKAIEISPRAIFYYHLGIALGSQKKWEDASNIYSKSIDLDPTNPDVYNNRGVVRYYLNDIKGSKSDLLIAARLYKQKGMEKEIDLVMKHIRIISKSRN